MLQIVFIIVIEWLMYKHRQVSIASVIGMGDFQQGVSTQR